MDSILTPGSVVLTSSVERCYMKLNVRILVSVLLLAGCCFAAPLDRDRDRDGWGDRHRHAVPEPGSMVMLTLTAGTLVGGMIARRRIQGKAAL